MNSPRKPVISMGAFLKNISSEHRSSAEIGCVVSYGTAQALCRGRHCMIWTFDKVRRMPKRFAGYALAMFGSDSIGDSIAAIFPH